MRLLQPSSPHHFCSLHVLCLLQSSSPQPFLFTSCHAFSAAIFTAAFFFTSCHVFSAAVFTTAIFVYFMSHVFCSRLHRSHFSVATFFRSWFVGVGANHIFAATFHCSHVLVAISGFLMLYLWSESSLLPQFSFAAILSALALTVFLQPPSLVAIYHCCHVRLGLWKPFFYSHFLRSNCMIGSFCSAAIFLSSCLS